MVGRYLPPFWIDWTVPIVGMVVCGLLMAYLLWG